MKKIILLSILFFSLTLMSFDCGTEITTEEVKPEYVPIISLEELKGQWNFVSYNLGSETFYNRTNVCDDIKANNMTKNYGAMIITLNFDGIKYGDYPGTCRLVDKCRSYNELCYSLDNKLNKITLGSIGSFVFKVLSYDKTLKKLTLKLESQAIIGGAPLNGVYVLQK